MKMDGNYMCKIFRTKWRNQKYNKDLKLKKSAYVQSLWKKHSLNNIEERKIGVYS